MSKSNSTSKKVVSKGNSSKDSYLNSLRTGDTKLDVMGENGGVICQAQGKVAVGLAKQFNASANVVNTSLASKNVEHMKITQGHLAAVHVIMNNALQAGIDGKDITFVPRLGKSVGKKLDPFCPLPNA